MPEFVEPHLRETIFNLGRGLKKPHLLAIANAEEAEAVIAVRVFSKPSPGTKHDSRNFTLFSHSAKLRLYISFKNKPEDFHKASIFRSWGTYPEGNEPGHTHMVDAKLAEFFRNTNNKQ